MSGAKSTMKLHPFWDVVENARQEMAHGAEIHLQFNCAHCGVKQTFGEPNYLSARGTCEQCNHVTSLLNDGCNLMVIYTSGAP